MRYLGARHAILFLPMLMLVALLCFPIAGFADSKSHKVEEQAESPEVANIVNRIIAVENQYSQ